MKKLMNINFNFIKEELLKQEFLNDQKYTYYKKFIDKYYNEVFKEELIEETLKPFKEQLLKSKIEFTISTDDNQLELEIHTFNKKNIQENLSQLTQIERIFYEKYIVDNLSFDLDLVLKEIILNLKKLIDKIIEEIAADMKKNKILQIDYLLDCVLVYLFGEKAILIEKSN